MNILFKSILIIVCTHNLILASGTLTINAPKRESVDFEIGTIVPLLKKNKPTQTSTLQAQDVAHCLRMIDKNKEHESLDSTRLQKLLYHTQGYHLSLYDEPFFKDDIIETIYGPYICDDNNEFSDKIEYDEKAPALSPEQLQFIKIVSSMETPPIKSNPLINSPREANYTKIPNNQIIDTTFMKSVFREIESWLPFIIQQLGTPMANTDVQELITYIREYMSYSTLSDNSINKISNSLSALKNNTNFTKNIHEWESLTKVKWPNQSELSWDTFSSLSNMKHSMKQPLY